MRFTKRVPGKRRGLGHKVQEHDHQPSVAARVPWGTQAYHRDLKVVVGMQIAVYLVGMGSVLVASSVDRWAAGGSHSQAPWEAAEVLEGARI